MILLDGSYGEGGGQILRTAFVLSLLTDQPFRIENIRAGRPNPGLKPQHLHIGKALLRLSDAVIDGLEAGSPTLSFWPGRLRGGTFRFEIGTAGAIPLFLQTLLPVACFAGESLRFSVTGGTDVRGAMTIDFWQMVLLPFLHPYARRLELEVVRHGFYPTGGGEVKVSVAPHFDQQNWRTQRADFPPLQISERGELQKVEVIARASDDLRERRVAERQSVGFSNSGRWPSLKPQNRYVSTTSTGSSLTAVAQYTQTRLGVDQLGERGRPAEAIGQAAAQALQAEMNSGATVDQHSADNLLIWAALFGGDYSFAEITGHITTNVWTINHFLPGALRLEDQRVTSGK